jgi:hypothetical protein
MWKKFHWKIKLGDLGPLSTQGPNNNTKIWIIEMKLRKTSIKPDIIMNIIEIRVNKKCYENDKKWNEKPKPIKLKKIMWTPNLS